MTEPVGYTPFGIANFDQPKTKKGLLRKLFSKFQVGSVSATVLDNSTDEIRTSSARDAGSSGLTIGLELSAGVTYNEMQSLTHPPHNYRGVSSPVKRLPLTLSTRRGQLTSDRRYWMMDENCRQCFECGARFTAIRRRHHCRVCGRIFCHQCSNQFLDGYLLGMAGLQRVCNFCAHTFRLSNVGSAVRGHAESPNPAGHSPPGNRCNDLWFRVGQNATRPLFSRSPNLVVSPNQSEVSDDSPVVVNRRSSMFPIYTYDDPLQPSDGPYLSPCCPSHAIMPQSRSSQIPHTGFLVSNSDAPSGMSAPTSLSDAFTEGQLLTLWSYMISSCPDSIPEWNEPSRELRNDVDTFGLSNLTYNPSELPLVTMVHESRTIYCTSGLNLVYWLVNNAPELRQCRTRARSVCQQFLDMSLLAVIGPATSKDRATFRDDFTAYELKQPFFNADHMPMRRRLSWPPDTPIRLSTSSRFLQHDHTEEPDWLQEIDNQTPSSSREVPSVSTPELLISPTNSKDESIKTELRTPVPGALSSPDIFEVDQVTHVPVGHNAPSHFALNSPDSISHLCGTGVLRSLASKSATLASGEKDSQLENLSSLFDDHLSCIIRQDTLDNRLDASWIPVLIRLSHAVCSSVHFDLRTTISYPTLGSTSTSSTDGSTADTRQRPAVVYSPMDVRYYVHIKKILTTANEESNIFPGVVFTKRAAHRFFFKELRNARILILAGCIDYQRTPSKLTQLEIQIMQEEEYLSNCVSKLLRLHPHVLLVGGSVSHIAQTLFLKAGITFFYNVKRSILLRVARITGSDILDSIDRLVGDDFIKPGQPQRTPTHLGISQQVRVQQLQLPDGSFKFLTYIQNAPLADPSVTTHRPSTSEITVLLRGQDLATLKRVKHCLLFALVVRYNLHLELSYAMDAHIYRPQSMQPDLDRQQYAQGDDQRVDSNGSPVCGKTPAPSELALYLQNRLFTLSPLVRMVVPFLASSGGQLAPLSAYYTYVSEWPFKRRLNDVLKRKLKVIKSELYAVRKQKQSNALIHPVDSDLTHHPFIDCALLFASTTQSANCPLTSEQNAQYTDFKARAFYPNSAETGTNNSFGSFKYWSYFLSALANSFDKIVSLRESFYNSRTLVKPTGPRMVKETMGKPSASKDDKTLIRPLVRSLLDPRAHQVFSFLTTFFSPKSPLWPEPCVPPWIASVEYYSPQDLPLGLFLERCCFTHKPCRHPHCDWPMSDHIQRFVQTQGSVQLCIRMLSQDPPKPAPSSRSVNTTRPDSRIIMWLACTTCRLSSPSSYLSAETWHYSFVKFLDTLINTATVEDRAAMHEMQTLNSVQALLNKLPCSHSAYKSLQHCFALDRRLAIFNYHPVIVYEVVMPPNEIRIHPSPAIAVASSTSSCCMTNSVPANSALSTHPIVPIPDYLFSEAFEVWEKYYRTCTAVKAHLVTLLHDNPNSELNAFLTACIELLESDSRRSHMEIRAELLSFLIRPENGLASLMRLLNNVTGSKHTASLSSNHSSQIVSDASTRHSGQDFEGDLYRTHDQTADDPNPEAPEQWTEEFMAQLSNSLVSIDPVEKAMIIQNLMNELKRWLYWFITFWNSRCTEYDTLLKRTEKLPKDMRKKLSVTSGPTSRESQQLNSDSEFLDPLKEGATCAHYSSTSTLLDLKDSHDEPVEGHGGRISDLDRPDEISLPKSATELLDLGYGVIDNPRLRYRKPTVLASSVSSIEQDLSIIVPSASDLLKDICHEGRVTLSAGNDSVVYEETRTTFTDGAAARSNFDSLKDDPTPQTFNAANSRVKSKTSESTVQAAASAATIPLAVPAGMRRFINTLMLPGQGGDPKPFTEPLPVNEHPQLSLTDEGGPIVSPYERPTGLVLSKPQSLDNPASATQFMNDLIQKMRLTVPDVYVNDQELTSIVAYALLTPEYERQLVDLHANSIGKTSTNSSSQVSISGASESGSTAKANSVQCSPQPSSRSSLNLKSNDLESVPRGLTRSSLDRQSKSSLHPPPSLNLGSSISGRQQTINSSVNSSTLGSNLTVPTEKINVGNNKHIKIQFSDCSTNFFCCVYYASEFFRLRQLVLPQGDVGFIRSLSRCFQWDARGGKSRSLFMKTKDERFVVKELSAIEMKTFHEISQNYFEYLIGAALEQRLCVLSRILGIFHVGYRNTLSGEAHRFDVLVMENLFHDRVQLTFIYDLKGSLRKRLAEETTQSSSEPSEAPMEREPGLTLRTQPGLDKDASGAVDSSRPPVPVLLDQNLLNASVDSPLYLRVHSKNALSHCLRVDTEFLSNLFIMDYSLLVGVDRSTNQLVIGLIDYLRKFTFDKRVEMMIKQTITSAQAPPPTILTPDLYRERFLMQMDDYFPLVPDQWYDSVAEHAEVWELPRIRRRTSMVH